MTGNKIQSIKRGFTIYFAVLVASLCLTIGVAIYDLIVRELALSQIATQSQYAIYAADTGIECALYWDFKYPDADGSVFGTSSPDSTWGTGAYCGTLDISGSWDHSDTSADAATTTFTLNNIGTGCALITVAKSGGLANPQTVITSNGRNTCAAVAPIKVERSLQAIY